MVDIYYKAEPINFPAIRKRLRGLGFHAATVGEWVENGELGIVIKNLPLGSGDPGWVIDAARKSYERMLKREQKRFDKEDRREAKKRKKRQAKSIA
jgi:hypothetical protein